MAWRSLLLFAVCCSLSVIVRFYVAKYTAAAAEAYARSKGASEVEMEAARHCLPPTVTAQGAS
ncbi:MAG: hypothetical protein WA615_16100 [Bradyrhizobium sp.]